MKDYKDFEKEILTETNKALDEQQNNEVIEPVEKETKKEKKAATPVYEESTDSSKLLKGDTAETTTLVRLREEPTYDATVLSYLQKGDKVVITDSIGEFYKVLVKGTPVRGYIASKFLKVV